MNDMFGLTLSEFYNLADWHPNTGVYLKDQGIDDKLVLAHAGTAALLPCSFDGAVPSRSAFSVSCTAFTAAAKGWWPCKAMRTRRAER